MLNPASSGFVRHAAALLLAVVCSTGYAGRAAAQAELEYSVKAAFLLRFGLYVTWPANAFAEATSPLVLCIVGDDPFGDVLDRAATEQRIEKHPVIIRRLGLAATDAECHIAYLGGGDSPRPAQAPAAAGGDRVLTVSDAARGTGSRDGIIHFVVRDNRVRFEIDDAAAARKGLTISSKLLGLALAVKRR